MYMRRGNAGQITLRFRVGGRAVLKVLALLGQRRRLVGNLVAVDDTHPGRHSLSGLMVLDIPGRRVHDLPDAAEIGLAVWSPRQGLIVRSLPAGNGDPGGEHQNDRNHHGQAGEPMGHRRVLYTHSVRERHMPFFALNKLVPILLAPARRRIRGGTI